MQSRNNTLSVLGFLAIVAFYCYTYYQEQLFMMPSLIHEWAQGDRLALAIAYYDNGMNFFKPATLAQFSIGGIVGVEFPIQAYLTAAIAHIFGREHISLIFRLLNTFISCIGLLYLFRTGYKYTQDFILSLLPPLFIFSSPIFIYYTCNYLPDTAGASMAFVGFYYLLTYLEAKRTISFLTAVFFFTLGTLIKTSIATYLLGFLGIVAIDLIRNRKELSVKKAAVLFGATVSSIAILLSHYVFIKYLNHKYEATLFLSRLEPFRSKDDFSYYIDIRFKRVWVGEYFILPQYVLFVAIVVSAIPILWKKRHGRQMLLLQFIYFIGAIALLYLMGHNLGAHDYYVIAIFLPFVAYSLLISMASISQLIKSKEGLQSVRVACLASVIMLFFFADFHASERLQPDYNGFSNDYRTSWLDSAQKVVADVGIEKHEHILILDEHPPNLPLIYFDRKGHVLSNDHWFGNMKMVLEYMNKYELKWLIIEEENEKKRLNGHQDIFSPFERVLARDRIVVYKLR